ncbi:MAG: O-methyltransferase [Bacteroidales bacterium]
MIDKKFEDYIIQYSTPEKDILYELARETHLKTIYPRMLSGHLQGLFLDMISRMIKPGLILEIGTFTGYSAVCLAQGLAENGVLHTIEINAELPDISSACFMKANVSDKILQHVGHALDIIPTLPDNFDLVFIDADKENYLNYYHLVFDKVKPGGFILADNVLWGGKVLENQTLMDKETQGIFLFNEFVKNDDRVSK